ncbi:jg5063 [Pararge aegeria aegeria]|uniref:Jg5063 protein n=1 Tax=Pararge aegeria aegeria TaxID=348720 RepID=A0A8S4R3C7_9NEOP|nr:jg5063 [Pararge aegeria aegeria]
MNKSLPSLSLFGNTYLEHLERRIHDSNNKQFSDEDLLTLYSVYGTALQRALDVLEKYPIVDTYSTANKGRVLIEIKGDNDRCYRVFPRINYCPCLGFRHQVIEKRCQITCKHILVGRIASILGKTVDREVTQEQYLMLVQSMFDVE